MLQIEIASLEPGVHTYDLRPESDALGLDPGAFSDISVTARLDYQGSRILVNLSVQATAHLECDRTLVPFDQVVNGDYTLLFAPEEPLADTDDSDEDIQVLEPGQQHLDLTTAARDTLLLAVPVRRVAPGAEDAELPVAFGTPKNGEPDIDPRWEALRKLRTE